MEPTMLSNEDNVHCSTKQQEPLVGLEPVPNTFPTYIMAYNISISLSLSFQCRQCGWTILVHFSDV